jgi:radical SAM-linked protein
MTPAERIKVRLRFVKLGKIRWTSHRDLARMWERALRRIDLPVAYTEGFSPRPRLSFGLALSTGHEGEAEYLDVELREAPDLTTLPAQLSEHLPVGIDVTAIAPLAAGSPSLQEDVTSCTWRIEVRDLEPADADELVEAALAADELVITRTRKGKEVTDDLRPAVLAVRTVGPTPAGTELEAELGVHPRSVRPSELLLALAPGRELEEGRVVRTAQWIWRDGARLEPLQAPPAATARPSREDTDVRARTASTGRGADEPAGAGGAAIRAAG